MPRLVLTALGVLALLSSTPAKAGASEGVRAGAALSRAAPLVDAPTGLAPRQASWKTVTPAEGHVGTGTPAVRPVTPEPLAVGTRPAEAASDGQPARPTRVLPDARAPPA